MDDSTYAYAQQYKEQLAFLNALKTELATPATQKVINLKARQHTTSLDSVLDAMESFLVPQAVTEVQNEIDSIQALFDAL